MGILRVRSLFSFTKVSSIADPLHPELTKATTGSFNLSGLATMALTSSEFSDHFGLTNQGFHCSSWIDSKASAVSSSFIHQIRVGVTSSIQVSWMNNCRCFRAQSLSVVSAIFLIHSMDHGSTEFIHDVFGTEVL